jgi:PAS domain S-box-containing protein
MMSLDGEGRIRMVNPAAVAILGRSRSSLEGSLYREIFAPETGLGRLLREGLERRQARSREMVPHLRPDGREIHLGVGLSPVVETDGASAGLVCLLSDLTEIRALREKVALKENLAQLGELSAGIAHEFRNSLATILGYARLIGRGEGGGAEDLARAILKEGQGIGKVVDSYLQYARPSALNLAEVDLRGVLEELAREFTSPGARAPIRVVIRGEFPRLQADEAILKQAFHNLIRNAAEAATGPGGQVTITGLPSERGTLRVEVADDGPGIPPEILPRIFTPFFTTRPDGTGLGLALVQKAIVSHDGTVEVISRPGEGTRVRIRLPLLASAELVSNL